MDTNILLESGTNELEILEFIVSGNYYGINVAKIREILTYNPLTPIPNGHPHVEGAFSTRLVHEGRPFLLLIWQELWGWKNIRTQKRTCFF